MPNAGITVSEHPEKVTIYRGIMLGKDPNVSFMATLDLDPSLKPVLEPHAAPVYDITKWSKICIATRIYDHPSYRSMKDIIKYEQSALKYAHQQIRFQFRINSRTRVADVFAELLGLTQVREKLSRPIIRNMIDIVTYVRKLSDKNKKIRFDRRFAKRHLDIGFLWLYLYGYRINMMDIFRSAELKLQHHHVRTYVDR